MSPIQADSAPTLKLLDAVAGGDARAMEQLLARFETDLRFFVEHRVDPRVQARFGTSDVVQEARIEVARRMDDFLRRRPMPFHLWIRRTAYQCLLNLHRNHRRRARRSVDREIYLPPASSAQIAASLLSREPTPGANLAAREDAHQVSKAVDRLAWDDREILLMRHMEELPYEEIACLLEITPEAARKRYGRAMIRLQRELTQAGLLE